MLKVLSTKLTADELARFTAMAKQQGESKGGYLRQIVQGHMNGVRKLDGAESVSKPHTAAPSKKDLVKEDEHVGSLPSSTDGLPVYQGESEGKPEGKPESSPKVLIGLGLGFASLFLLWLKRQPESNTDGQPVFDSSSPYLDAYGKFNCPT